MALAARCGGGHVSGCGLLGRATGVTAPHRRAIRTAWTRRVLPSQRRAGAAGGQGCFLPASRAIVLWSPRLSRALARSRHFVMAQAPPLTAVGSSQEPGAYQRGSQHCAARSPNPTRRKTHHRTEESTDANSQCAAHVTSPQVTTMPGQANCHECHTRKRPRKRRRTGP
jgi:hypothetical protein